MAPRPQSPTCAPLCQRRRRPGQRHAVEMPRSDGAAMSKRVSFVWSGQSQFVSPVLLIYISKVQCRQGHIGTAIYLSIYLSIYLGPARTLIRQKIDR
eukprot:scaffold107438_cov63-Phaeocystis_antarctica.AAC.1